MARLLSCATMLLALPCAWGFRSKARAIHLLEMVGGSTYARLVAHGNKPEKSPTFLRTSFQAPSSWGIRSVSARTRSISCISSNNASSSTSSSSSTVVSRVPHFNREHELSTLCNLLSTEPSTITVVLGPRNSGKTTLLEQFVNEHKVGTSLSYVDCRMIDATTPEGFAAALARQGLPALIQGIPRNQWRMAFDIVNWIVPGVMQEILSSAKVTGKLQAWGVAEEIGVQLADFLKKMKPSTQVVAPPPPSSIGQVIDVYDMLLTAWEAAQNTGRLVKTQWPVVIIDEAHMLVPWSKAHPDQLTRLLNFFIAITKRRRCHMVLVSSENCFQAWVQQRIWYGYYSPKVVGDFQEAQARSFLEHKLGDGVKIGDDDLARVYQVCGGNAGALLQTAAAYVQTSSASGNWTSALEEVSKTAYAVVEEAASGGPSWTPAQFADAALLLLDSEYGAVEVTQMQEQLGRHVTDDAAMQDAAGKAALSALVEANRLSIRPYSSWALDIPREAHGPHRIPMEIVTVASSVEAYCMRVMRKDLEAALQQWEQQQAGGRRKANLATRHNTAAKARLEAQFEATVQATSTSGRRGSWRR